MKPDTPARAFDAAFPALKPWNEQPAGSIRIPATQYAESVLWAEANAPAPPAPSTGWTEYDPDDSSGWFHASTDAQITAGVAQLNSGAVRGVAILRGKTYSVGLGRIERNGTADAPTIIGAYGDPSLPRPILLVSSGMVLATRGPNVSHVHVHDLDFRAVRPDPLTESIGLDMLSAGEGWLIEGCAFQGFGGSRIQSDTHTTSNFTVRRSQFLDSYHIAGKSHSQGIFVHGVKGLLIEENVFDHNGWKVGVPGAQKTMFNHNLYITTENEGVVVRGNTIANASSHGMQLRCGGVAEDNLFVLNPINFAGGMGDEPHLAGVEVWLRSNVFLGGGDIDPANTRGHCVWLGNIRRGEMSGNIIADGTGGQQHPLVLDADSAGTTSPPTPTCGVLDFKINGNVRRGWGGTIVIDPGPTTGTTPLAEMGLDERADLVGIDIRLETHWPGFLASARANRRGAWNEAVTAARYNAWARGRFGMVSP